MRSSWSLLLSVLLVSCGGGGGSASVPPAGVPVSLQIPAATIAAGQSSTDLTVSLAGAGDSAPVLLQAAVALPPELVLATSNQLVAATSLTTLDGNFTDNRFHILCGDASNRDAKPLPEGALFRLRVVASNPRTPGTYTVTFQDLAAATSAGANVALVADRLTVAVTIE